MSSCKSSQSYKQGIYQGALVALQRMNQYEKKQQQTASRQGMKEGYRQTMQQLKQQLQQRQQQEAQQLRQQQQQQQQQQFGQGQGNVNWNSPWGGGSVNWGNGGGGANWNSALGNGQANWGGGGANPASMPPLGGPGFGANNYGWGMGGIGNPDGYAGYGNLFANGALGQPNNPNYNPATWGSDFGTNWYANQGMSGLQGQPGYGNPFPGGGAFGGFGGNMGNPAFGAGATNANANWNNYPPGHNGGGSYSSQSYQSGPNGTSYHSESMQQGWGGNQCHSESYQQGCDGSMMYSRTSMVSANNPCGGFNGYC